MSEFELRLTSLLIGCFIGFILGYIVRYLREIKEELDEVDEALVTRGMKKRRSRTRDRNDAGQFYGFKIKNMVLFFVVMVVAWSAFATQRAADESKQASADSRAATADVKANQDRISDVQEKLVRLTVCNQKFLLRTIEPLNERTEYSKKQLDANVELIRAQADMLEFLVREPPETEDRIDEAIREYFASTREFVDIGQKSSSRYGANKYPTGDEFFECVGMKDEDQND